MILTVSGLAIVALVTACGGDGPEPVDEGIAPIDVATPTPQAADHGSHEGDGAGLDNTEGHEGDGEGDEVTVTVTTERIAFKPAEIRIRVGQVVRLKLVNADPLLHDFTVDEGDFEVLESVGAAHDMEGMGDGDAHDGDATDEHGDTSLHVAADANGEGLLVFRPLQPGEYDVYCTVPGHREAGMEAKLIVEP